MKQVTWVIVWVVAVAFSLAFLGQAGWLHAWWKAVLVLLPDVAVPIIALRELAHSREANALRAERNALARENNYLARRNMELATQMSAIESEKNEALQKIAENMKRPRTMGERNAEMLKRHLHEYVSVNEGQGHWGGMIEVAEVRDDGVFTLFIAATNGSEAWAQQVHCDQVEIVDVPNGSCQLRLNILKRHGSCVLLGNIRKYEDRRR